MARIKNLIEAIVFLQGYPLWVKTTVIVCVAGIVILAFIAVALLTLVNKHTDTPGAAQKSLNHDSCFVDSSFGTKGYVKLGSRNDTLEGVSIAYVGSDIAVLSVLKGKTGNRIRVDRMGPNGDIDHSFGHQGIGYISFPLGSPYRAAPERLTVLPNGYLLVTGTAFDDTDGSAHAFLAKVSGDGSLDDSFGANGILILPDRGGLNYGWDTAHIGDDLYTVSSTYGSGSISIHKVSLQGSVLSDPQGLLVNISSDQMAWPTRLVRIFPENKFYVAGKLNGSGGRKTDGFLAKIDTAAQLDNAFGDNGVFWVKDKLEPPFINNISGLAVFPDGEAVVSGDGNEGFAVAADGRGASKTSFGNAGSYVLRGVHRTDASSILLSATEGFVAIGGMESDGNSVMRGFVAFTDLSGRELSCGDDNMVRVQMAGTSKVIDLTSVGDGVVFGLVQEGVLSQISKRVAVTKIKIQRP